MIFGLWFELLKEFDELMCCFQSEVGWLVGGVDYYSSLRPKTNF